MILDQNYITQPLTVPLLHFLHHFFFSILTFCSQQLEALKDQFFYFSFSSQEKYSVNLVYAILLRTSQCQRIASDSKQDIITIILFLPFIYICFEMRKFFSNQSSFHQVPLASCCQGEFLYMFRFIYLEENQKPEFETLLDLLVFTGSPTVPPSEMTTEDYTDKEGGILGGQQGNRKTEGAAETVF